MNASCFFNGQVRLSTSVRSPSVRSSSSLQIVAAQKLQGKVTSTAMNKTVTVTVDR